MRGSAFSEKKPWRRFRRSGRHDAVIRRICYAALILEAAVLTGRQGMDDLLALRMEKQEQEWVSPAGKEQDETGMPEEIFGVRFRLKDGAVEFYRKERASREAPAETPQKAPADMP